MNELKCPRCGQVFQVDAGGYTQLLQQVRDHEFEKELSRREAELEERSENRLAIARLEEEKQQQLLLSEKDSALAKREQEIAALKAELESADTRRRLAVTEALREKEKELSDKEAHILTLSQQLAGKDTELELKEKSLKEGFAQQLKMKDEQLEYYKDFKARQSTKMVGESLEQHCENEFNKLRMSAFPHSVFHKDNDARSGSKGDYIFREAGEDGTEFISIMFEMKNETDSSSAKHKNEHFFKELDKDRREKKCEYAVLVSLLEPESDLYNTGIVDVSYAYEKMYVIRPQFFIPLITLLRNAAKGSLAYRQELSMVRNQQLDVTHFEENMNKFKEGFARNYRLASDRFRKAIEEIDKTIEHLQKTKDALLSSESNLRLANDKAEDLSIKKLTKNAPSVRKMFEQREPGESAD